MQLPFLQTMLLLMLNPLFQVKEQQCSKSFLCYTILPLKDTVLEE